MQPSEPTASFRDLLETVFRRKRIVLVTVPSVLLLVLLVTLFTPKLYQSEMKILVQNARGNIVISADKSTASAASDVTEEQINSELEILHSRDVLDLVADPEWTKKPASSRTLEEVNRHDKLLTRLEKRMTAESGRKSNVITVTYQGATPLESQQTLTRLENAFLNQERHLERPSGASDFFVQESDRYRQAWNDATQRFVDFQQKHQIVSLPDQEASSQKDILTLQAQLREMDTSLNELTGRLDESTRSLRDTPQRQLTEQKSVPNQQSVQQLNTLVVTLENKRTTLLTQFKADDRLVLEVEQQIRQTRAALEEASHSSAQEQTTDVNPAWQQLRNRSVQDVVARRALQSQRAAVGRQLAKLQSQLSDMQSLTAQFNLLKSKADELKENYQLYSQKREQAQIEDAMDARQLLNVTIAERPTFSNLKVRPQPIKNFALGLLTACFLSLALIYLAELGRTTIVTPRELETASSYPVLATVPLARVGKRLPSGNPNFHGVRTSAALLESLTREKREEKSA